MGVLLKWHKPNSEVSYDTVRVYRATSESGDYSQIASQVIADNAYYDIDGTTSHWYKIDFYDTSELKVSALSDAMQGGAWSGYCTPNMVRELTNLTSSDMTDSEIYNCIQFAMYQVSSDIQVRVVRERIKYIDETRENDLDASNTIFYVRNWKEFIGDDTSNGEVTIADITVYQVDNEGTETELTVSSITPDEGKFVLSSAPSTDVKLFVTYQYAPVSIYQPHPLVKTACALLSAAHCYLKLNVGKAEQFRIGNMTVYRHMKSYDVFYSRYLKVIEQINNRMADIREASQII